MNGNTKANPNTTQAVPDAGIIFEFGKGGMRMIDISRLTPREINNLVFDKMPCKLLPKTFIHREDGHVFLVTE